MATNEEMMQAKATYATLCEMLDEHEWKYARDDEALAVDTGASGDDLPMKLRIEVDAERQLVSLISKLDFSIPDDKRVEMSLAVSMINYTMVDGCFDYNFLNGNIVFRLTTSYRGSMLSKDAMEYMLFVSCRTIDDSNDKLLMLTKGALSLEDIMKAANE